MRNNSKRKPGTSSQPPNASMVGEKKDTAGIAARRLIQLQESAPRSTDKPTENVPNCRPIRQTGGNDYKDKNSMTDSFRENYAQEKYVDLKIDNIRGEVKACVAEAKHDLLKTSVGIIIAIAIAAITWHLASINIIRNDIQTQIEYKLSPIKYELEKKLQEFNAPTHK